MKKILLALLFSIPLLTVAQDAEPTSIPATFTWVKDVGLTNFIVVPVTGKTADDLYMSAVSWVTSRKDLTYEDTQHGKSLRLKGTTDKLHCYTAITYTNCLTTEYVIDMFFKDGKYRMEVISMRSDHGDKLGGWQGVEIFPPFNYKYYNKKGEIRGVFKWLESSLPKFFDDLSFSYKAAATKTSPANDNDW